MQGGYSPKSLRFDLIAGSLALAVFFVTVRAGRSGLLLVVMLFSGLGTLIAFGRAFYEGTTLLYWRVPQRLRAVVQVFTVSAAWLLAFSQFAPDASLRRVQLPLSTLLFVGGMALLLGWFARAMTASARPHPRMRAYLMTLAVLILLLGPRRYGYSFSSSDDGSDVADSREEAPTAPKDAALFHFMLYSASCFLGVASVRKYSVAT